MARGPRAEALSPKPKASSEVNPSTPSKVLMDAGRCVALVSWFLCFVFPTGFEPDTERDTSFSDKLARWRKVEQEKQTCLKCAYHRVDLDQLLAKSSERLKQLYSAQQRRRLSCSLSRKQHSALRHLREPKKEAAPMEKPEAVNLHLRDMIILPEKAGSMVGVCNGKAFNQVEAKPEMLGHHLGELSITHKPVNMAGLASGPPTLHA